MYQHRSMGAAFRYAFPFGSDPSPRERGKLKSPGTEMRGEMADAWSGFLQAKSEDSPRRTVSAQGRRGPLGLPTILERKTRPDQGTIEVPIREEDSGRREAEP
ncbi:hypothetical protein NDU88_006586 [Pleurodeles waltl]|uniref:Uncharacterized protein n=1 Tax=Pleurodeles waltl TaxID=8319 RepID=A0AAV7MZM4_PLEWA|nr:hypothetical protein NDU88_006586 [Pleurodeles waltl]